MKSWVLSYLLNSLWQIPLLFAAGWVAARALRRVGSAAEHRVWVSVLLLQTLLPACSTLPPGWLKCTLRLGPDRTPLRRSAGVSGDGRGHWSGHVSPAGRVACDDRDCIRRSERVFRHEIFMAVEKTLRHTAGSRGAGADRRSCPGLGGMREEVRDRRSIDCSFVADLRATHDGAPAKAGAVACEYGRRDCRERICAR